MRLLILLSLLLGVILVSPVMAEKLTIERLEASPSLAGPTARGVQVAPDSSRVTFLQGRPDDLYQQDLWEYHIADGERRMLVDSVQLLGGEEILDEVEKARRERQRIFTRGIIEYRFSPDGKALLFPLGGDLYYLPLGGEPRRLTHSAATETDARISPLGNYVSFIREQNLYVIELSTGLEQAITTAGGGAISFGMADFAAQEEMYRYSGYWWSPDDRQIALARVDETPVTVVNRYEIGEDGVTSVAQRYPFAGEKNALVSLHMATLGAGEEPDSLRQLDLGNETDIYLARVSFAPDGTLAVQRQSRDQKTLDLLFFENGSTAPVRILTERSDSWINLHSDLFFFEDSSRFLWTSERDGYRHIYLYQRDGTMLRQLTTGTSPVAESGRSGGGVRALDERNGDVFYLSWSETPAEQHLFRVALDGDSEPRQLTRARGWHSASVAPSGDFFIENGQAPSRPPYAAVRDRDGSLLTWILENPLDDSHPYAPWREDHIQPEFGVLPATDGSSLHYRLFRPADFDPAQQYPAIIHVYGGPGGAQVQKTWSVGLNQLLAREGFVVFTVDNRGTGGRGTAFDDPIHLAMGGVEVEDQVTGARWLGSQSWVDAERIGIYGGSYGGYMTLLALFQASEIFAAGVAMAPVTDWRLYDTHYTERYLGDPAQGDVYRDTSPMSYVDGLNDPLLLIHGMADDNVFFDHSVKLMSALQKARKPFELMTYPGKRHRITGEDERVHVYSLLLDFFQRHLSGELAP